jgi:adenosylcobinamide kinase/adenosylcobinamide-phosphate guanylyltransferase
MAKITFITGGARSGKSQFAQQLAEKNSGSPVYLATARVWDDDFQKRIARHQSDRGQNWQTIEELVFISKHNLAGKTVVFDCITLWLTNIFFENNSDIETSLEFAKTEWNRFIQADFTLFVVSNELGMGVHPENEIARKFADLQGWTNQYIAKNANCVYFMVSGIPVKIK